MDQNLYGIIHAAKPKFNENDIDTLLRLLLEEAPTSGITRSVEASLGSESLSAYTRSLAKSLREQLKKPINRREATLRLILKKIGVLASTVDNPRDFINTWFAFIQKYNQGLATDVNNLIEQITEAVQTVSPAEALKLKILTQQNSEQHLDLLTPMLGGNDFNLISTILRNYINSGKHSKALDFLYKLPEAFLSDPRFTPFAQSIMYELPTNIHKVKDVEKLTTLIETTKVDMFKRHGEGGDCILSALLNKKSTPNSIKTLVENLNWVEAMRNGILFQFRNQHNNSFIDYLLKLRTDLENYTTYFDIQNGWTQTHPINQLKDTINTLINNRETIGEEQINKAFAQIITDETAQKEIKAFFVLGSTQSTDNRNIAWKALRFSKLDIFEYILKSIGDNKYSINQVVDYAPRIKLKLPTDEQTADLDGMYIRKEKEIGTALDQLIAGFTSALYADQSNRSEETIKHLYQAGLAYLTHDKSEPQEREPSDQMLLILMRSLSSNNLDFIIDTLRLDPEHIATRMADILTRHGTSYLNEMIKVEVDSYDGEVFWDRGNTQVTNGEKTLLAEYMEHLGENYPGFKEQLTAKISERFNFNTDDTVEKLRLDLHYILSMSLPSSNGIYAADSPFVHVSKYMEELGQTEEMSNFQGYVLNLMETVPTFSNTAPTLEEYDGDNTKYLIALNHFQRVNETHITTQRPNMLRNYLSVMCPNIVDAALEQNIEFACTVREDGTVDVINSLTNLVNNLSKTTVIPANELLTVLKAAQALFVNENTPHESAIAQQVARLLHAMGPHIGANSTTEQLTELKDLLVNETGFNGAVFECSPFEQGYSFDWVNQIFRSNDDAIVALKGDISVSTCEKIIDHDTIEYHEPRLLGNLTKTIFPGFTIEPPVAIPMINGTNTIDIFSYIGTVVRDNPQLKVPYKAIEELLVIAQNLYEKDAEHPCLANNSFKTLFEQLTNRVAKSGMLAKSPLRNAAKVPGLGQTVDHIREIILGTEEGVVPEFSQHILGHAIPEGGVQLEGGSCAGYGAKFRESQDEACHRLLTNMGTIKRGQAQAIAMA